MQVKRKIPAWVPLFACLVVLLSPMVLSSCSSPEKPVVVAAIDVSSSTRDVLQGQAIAALKNVADKTADQRGRLIVFVFAGAPRDVRKVFDRSFDVDCPNDLLCNAKLREAKKQVDAELPKAVEGTTGLSQDSDVFGSLEAIAQLAKEASVGRPGSLLVFSDFEHSKGWADTGKVNFDQMSAEQIVAWVRDHKLLPALDGLHVSLVGAGRGGEAGGDAARSQFYQQVLTEWCHQAKAAECVVIPEIVKW